MIVPKICLVLPMAARITRIVSVVIGAYKNNWKVKSKAKYFQNFQSVTEDWVFHNLHL